MQSQFLHDPTISQESLFVKAIRNETHVNQKECLILQNQLLGVKNKNGLRPASRNNAIWGSIDLALAQVERGARVVICANDHFLLVHGFQTHYRQFENLTVPTK